MYAIALDWRIMLPALRRLGSVFQHLYCWLRSGQVIEPVRCPQCDASIRLRLDTSSDTAAVVERRCWCRLSQDEMAALESQAFEQWEESRIW